MDIYVVTRVEDDGMTALVGKLQVDYDAAVAEAQRRAGETVLTFELLTETYNGNDTVWWASDGEARYYIHRRFHGEYSK